MLRKLKLAGKARHFCTCTHSLLLLRNMMTMILTQSPDQPWLSLNSNEPKPVCHKWPPITAILFSYFSLLLTLVSREFWGQQNWCYSSLCLRNSRLRGCRPCHFGQHPNQSTQAKPLLGYLHLQVCICECVGVWTPTALSHIQGSQYHLKEHCSFLYCGKIFNNTCAHR